MPQALAAPDLAPPPPLGVRARERLVRLWMGAPCEVALQVRGRTPEPVRPVHAVVRRLSPVQRVEHSVAWLVGGAVFFVIHILLMAVIHAIAPPLLLFAAIIIAVRRLFTRAVWQFAAGTCPHCEQSQRFFVFGAVSLPAATSCASCARELWIEPPGQPVH
ncbi:MAG: hypothetical protein SFU84_06910 [Gemmatimonadales bacterium]|nr:hypothetical protein [Gemmatimonadales bacterium]